MACMISSCSASFSSFVRPILPAILRTAAAIVKVVRSSRFYVAAVLAPTRSESEMIYESGGKLARWGGSVDGARHAPVVTGCVQGVSASGARCRIAKRSPFFAVLIDGVSSSGNVVLSNGLAGWRESPASGP